MLTQAQLKEYLHYNPETGIFTWIKNPRNKNNIGGVAGTLHNPHKKDGYLQIKLHGYLILSHRLAWLYMTGNMPTHQIDHINGIKYDNKFSNLRECNNSQNHMNLGLRSNNKSGYKGVCYNKANKKWTAQCKFNGVYKFLGNYETPELASKAYVEYAKKECGEFFKY